MQLQQVELIIKNNILLSSIFFIEVTQERINELQTDSGASYAKHFQLVLIHGELHTKEILAINNLARKLGTTGEQIE
jgi:hypothetical protein